MKKLRKISTILFSMLLVLSASFGTYALCGNVTGGGLSQTEITDEENSSENGSNSGDSSQNVDNSSEVAGDADEEVDDEDDTGEETDPSATTVTSEAGFTYTLSSSDQTATLSSYSGTTAEITIATTILVADDGTVTEDPEDVSSGTTYSVTAIGSAAFYNNTTITAVTGGGILK